MLSTAVSTSQYQLISSYGNLSASDSESMTCEVRQIRFQILILSLRSQVTMGKWLGAPLF